MLIKKAGSFLILSFPDRNWVAKEVWKVSAGKASMVYLTYCGRSNLIAIPSTAVQV